MSERSTGAGADRATGSSRLRSVVETTIATVLIQASGLVTGAIVARMLGVEGRGLLAAMMVWTAGLANLGDLGGPVAYTYQSAQPDINRRTLVRNAVTLTAIQGFVLAAIGIPLMALVLHGSQNLIPIAIGYVLSYIPLNLLARYLQAIHQGERNFGRFNGARYSLTLSYLVLIVVLALLGMGSVEAVLVAVVASNLVAVTVVSRGLSVFSSLRTRFDAKLARSTFAFGIKAHFGTLTPIDSMQLDMLVVVSFLGPREAGLYAVGSAAAGVIRAQGTAIGLVALPNVASERTDLERAETAGLFFRAAAYAGVAMSCFIFLTAHLLVPLIYGSAFSGAVGIVKILVVGIVAASLRQVLGDCLRGAGWPLQGTIAEVSSWVIAAGALVILVPMMGAAGAAVSVCISYFAALLLMFVLAAHRGLKTSVILLPRRDDLRHLRRLLPLPSR